MVGVVMGVSRGARGARGVLGWFLSTQISVIALIRADDVRCDDVT